jgi:hypothetical protein
MQSRTRREFLSEVGCGALAAALGAGVLADLGLASPGFAAAAGEETQTLSFGALEPLVRLMQETPVNRLLPMLTAKLKAGTGLRELLAAGALANARTFGGEDYVGFHTMMALAPAYHMSAELPEARRALPVLKVLYRNTNRIQEHGGRTGEVLHPVAGTAAPGHEDALKVGESIRAAVRQKDGDAAERTFAALVAGGSAEDAFDGLLVAVEDATEVHRVVLPYRAWDLLDLVGREHAHTLLRQSVRYCIKAETWVGQSAWNQPRALLPKLLEEHHLLDRDRRPGARALDDKAVEELSRTIFAGTPDQAAGAVAAALAEGVAPAAIGEAVSLAANQLVLRDIGRTARDEVSGKPMGSVHGDSIGVHACDSANAWRNMSRIASAPRHTYACLILGAYQVAFDRINRGGDFLNWKPLPLENHVAAIKETDATALLNEAEQAIKGNLQAHAAAAIHRYGQLGHPERPAFDMMLKYAVSEDGSLHGEKFYRTTSEEFAALRPAFRWRQVVALARVTASEYGRPAPGVAEARELLSA